MSKLPFKAVFLIGLVLGAGVVAAVTFNAGDAGTVSDGVTFASPDGGRVTITGQTDVIMEGDTLFPDSQTTDLRTEAGNVTFAAPGTAIGTIHTSNITGTYTSVTSIDAANNDLTINPEDKQRITVGGDIDHVAWQDTDAIGVDDGNVDFSYGGASGTSTVQIGGVPASTEIAAIDAQTNAVLDVATSDASGQISFTSLDNSDHNVELQTSDGGPSLSNSSPDQQTFRFETVELSVDVADSDLPDDNVTLRWYVDGTLENTTYATSGGTHTANVTLPDGQYDWYVEAEDAYGQTDASATNSFTINHFNPEVSDIDPSGNLQTDPSEIDFNISDDDFEQDGDTVSYEVIVDGSTVTTGSVSQNREVSVSMPSRGKTGGEHDIQVDLTDDYGQTTTGTSSYTVPNTLFVRNESNHSQLVSSDGEVRFLGDDRVVSRTAPNGKINMTGLNVGQSFIVEVKPTDSNYTERTIYVNNIYEQQSAYVLNTTAFQTVESRFVLNDPTAQFGAESVIQIKRPINISGNVTFQTVRADRFGQEGVTATLQRDTRYRLTLINERYNQKVGVYRSQLNETVEVTPGQPTIALDDSGLGYAYGASLDNTTLTYNYVDPAQETDKLTVYIHERGDPQNRLQPNETVFDLGNYSGQASLTANESEKEWVVEFVIERNGETIVNKRDLSNRQDLTLPVDSGWKSVISVSLLLLFAGAFSVLNAAIGAVVVSLMGGILFFIGFLSGATSGAAVVMAIFISTIMYLAKGGV